MSAVQVRSSARRLPGTPAGQWLASGALLLLWVATVLQSVTWWDTDPWSSALMVLALPTCLALYPDATTTPALGWAVVAAAIVLAGAYPVLGAEVARQPWWAVLVLAVTALAGTVAIQRYRRRLDTRERAAMRWAIVGALLTVQGMLLLFLLGTAAGGNGIWGLGAVGAVAATVVALVFPAAASAGLVAGERLALDRILGSTIAVSIVGWVVAIAAAAVVAVAWRAGFGPIGLAGWAALVAAGAAVPAWSVARRAADRLVFGGRPDPWRTAGDTLEAVAGATAVEDLLASVVRVAARATGSPSICARAVGVTVRTGSGVSAGPVEEFVLTHRGEQLGVLRLAPRPAETALTARDRAVARAVVDAAAPALYGVRESGALSEARTALLLAREEERRDLRRDLHDDLAPTLVGLGLTASGVARMLDEVGEPVDRERLAALTAGLARDLQAAIAQTRQLALGLRPPVLDDLGLVAAIRDRTRAATDAVALTVVAAPEPLVLPAAVELAALRIVAEAVTNTRRHSRARRCAVRLVRTADALEIEVRDDGRGLPVDLVPGLGLASIRARARELGGTLEVESLAEGGTRVWARLPAGTP